LDSGCVCVEGSKQIRLEVGKPSHFLAVLRRLPPRAGGELFRCRREKGRERANRGGFGGDGVLLSAGGLVYGSILLHDGAGRLHKAHVRFSEGQNGENVAFLSFSSLCFWQNSGYRARTGCIDDSPKSPNTSLCRPSAQTARLPSGEGALLLT
jgi:hypothetical protein